MLASVNNGLSWYVMVNKKAYNQQWWIANETYWNSEANPVLNDPQV